MHLDKISNKIESLIERVNALNYNFTAQYAEDGEQFKAEAIANLEAYLDLVETDLDSRTELAESEE